MTNDQIDLGIPGLEDATPVGRGGFATVYRASQPAFRRVVAVKVLATTDLDEGGRRRFEREVQAMGLLSEHPAIVTVHDAGFTPDGRPYLVMAYVPGGSLATRIDEGRRTPWREVAALGISIAGALETAHRAGVIHRDVKPANILVSPYGPQLTDFGIARIAGGHETRTGVVSASIAHAAPEILDGQRPSVAGDVYALGSTLYTLLAGRPAFAHESDESIVPMMFRIHTEPVPDLGPDVPADLAEVVANSMAKDAAERPASMLELGRRLQAVQRAHQLPVTDLVLGASAAGSDEPEREADPPADAHATRTVVVADVPDREGGRGMPPDDAGEQLDDAVPERSSGRRRVLALVAVLGVVGLLAGAIVLSARGDGTDPVGGPSTSEPATTPTTTPATPATAPATAAATTAPAEATTTPPTVASTTSAAATTTAAIETTATVAPSTAVPLPVAVTDVVDVGGAVFTVALAGGALWAPAGPASLVRIDPATATVTDTIALNGRPETPVVADGDLWVPLIDAGSVDRVDLSAGTVVGTISVGANPFTPGVGPGALWVPNRDDGTVSRIDTGTGLVTDTIVVGGSPSTPVVDDGAVWVASGEEGTVARIDAASRTVTDTIEVGAAPLAPVLTAGALWVTVGDPGRVVRIDPATRAVTDEITVGDGSGQPVPAGGALWVTDATAGTVARIDPGSPTVAETFTIGGNPLTPVAFAGALWIPDRTASTVARFGLAAGGVTDTFQLASRPDTPLAADGAIWVSDIDAGTVVRIAPAG